jgi:threonine/homoserine/homoserine lactone efflux protein
MIDWSSYLLFLVACAAFILAPGPAQALVVAKTLAEGRCVGVLTAIGLNIGTLFHAVAAALGLSALLASSALAFSVVKYLGAAYLIYLGIRALRAGPQASSLPTSTRVTASKSALWQAVLVGTLNPKVALFFLAFLPQFVNPQSGSVVLQFLVLGTTMAALDVLYEVVLVQLVSRMRRRMLGSVRFVLWQNRISGAVLVALGLRLAVQER